MFAAVCDYLALLSCTSDNTPRNTRLVYGMPSGALSIAVAHRTVASLGSNGLVWSLKVCDFYHLSSDY